jgi:Dolichyl-phosphate-mannose-protein mannosyltransferase
MSRAARIACYGALGVCLIVFAWLRFRERAMPLERDEGEYAYMGQLMLQGIPPYKLASNMKLPGTYAGYAAIMAVFGESASGIHLGMIVVTSLCGLLVFLLGKYLWTPLAGTVAGCSYLFLAIRPAVLGIVAHATHFVVLAALAGTLLLLHAIDRKSTSLFFGSGLAFGIAFLMKQPGIFFAVFAAVCWFWSERKAGLSFKNLLVRGSALAAGVVLPYVLTCLWLWHAGVFANFWFWTWSYARAYGSMVTWSQAWNDNLKILLPWVFRPFAFWELALLGLAAPLWSRYARARGAFVAGFLLTSCLAVIPGLYFRPHYFILVLPAGALCIGIALECLQQEVSRRWNGRLAFLPLTYFAIVYVLAIRGQWKDTLHLAPNDLSEKIYAAGFVQSVSVADFIRSRSSPQDQIGVFGSEPEICFYAHLHCATSYLYLYPLLEQHHFASQMQEQMKRELQAAPPRFFVVVDDWSVWRWAPTLRENRDFFDWGWTFAHSGDYQLVDEVRIPANINVVCLWGPRPSFYVFQRKD